MSATEPGVGSDQDSHARIREGRGADSQEIPRWKPPQEIRPNGKVGWKMSNVDNTDPTILKNPCLSITPLGSQVVFGKLDVGSEATEEATKEDGKEDKDQQEALTPGVPYGCGLYIFVRGIGGYTPNLLQFECGLADDLRYQTGCREENETIGAGQHLLASLGVWTRKEVGRRRSGSVGITGR